MDDELKIYIINYIKYLKRTTPEEIKMITLSCYKIALLSILTFGLNNELTKDSYNILKEYVDICNIENDIFNFIIDNIDNLNLDSTIDYIDDLDQLNETTYLYYDGLIADIEYAIDVKNPRLGKRRYQNFNSLIDSDYYYDKLDTLKKGR